MQIIIIFKLSTQNAHQTSPLNQLIQASQSCEGRMGEAEAQ